MVLLSQSPVSFFPIHFKGLFLSFKPSFLVNGLVLPKERTTGVGCIPEGRIVSYQCTIIDTFGIAATIWRGSAFSCLESSSQIVLVHSQYESGLLSECGNLTAMNVGINGTEYISRLTLTATTELNGTVISCTLSNVVLIGSDTLSVGG